MLERLELTRSLRQDHNFVQFSLLYDQALAPTHCQSHTSLMFNFVRAIMLTLILTFSAGIGVGPAAAASMNIAMATSMVSADGTMKDCADQTSAKATMQNCDLVCSATASFAMAPAQDVAFSASVFALEHLCIDVRADGRTVAYVSPPPRRFILI